MSLPYALRLHDKDVRKELVGRYEESKDQLNKMIMNIGESDNALKDHLSPVTELNPQKTTMVAQSIVKTLAGMSQNMPMIHTALYGDSDPSFEGMANFVDAMDTLMKPNDTLSAMGSGDATPLQMAVFKSAYPSMYGDYKTGLLKAVATNDLSPDRTSLVYRTTGIETDPKYSKSSFMQDIAAKQQAQMAPQQAPKMPNSQRNVTPSKAQVTGPSYSLKDALD